MTLSSKKTKYKGKNYYKENQKFLDIKKQALRQGVQEWYGHPQEREGQRWKRRFCKCRWHSLRHALYQALQQRHYDRISVAF